MKSRSGTMSITLNILLISLVLCGIPITTTFPGLTSSGPLYTSSDFVYLLNATTIEDKVFGSSRAWFVEFFSSWCGHCIAYAPKWKQFADDLKGWRSIVVVAAIDCAVEENLPSCRQFEIMGYPTLKIFKNNCNSKVIDSDGKEVLNIGELMPRTETMPKLKMALIDALVVMFPKLLQVSDTITTNLTIPADYWSSSEFKDGPEFLLLVYESPGSYVGLEVTLRLSRYQNHVRVLRMNQKNPTYHYLALDTWPAAGYISKEGSSGSIILQTNQDMMDLLTVATINLAKIEKIDERPEGADEQETETTLRPDGDDTGVGHPIPAEDTVLGDRVSMEDLLHTIRYSLRNEVGLLQKLDGTKLTALKNYLKILSQYFPSDRREIQLFLVKLADWIQPEEEIEIFAYLEKLTELEAELKPWDANVNIWYDCRPTIPGRRGYTCGLWRLFHALTIIGVEKHEDSPILGAIHGYVTEFFGCTECSKHFNEMVQRDNTLSIIPIRQQMIWLWKAHNEVNLRLKGTPSEDPGFPKIQYPSLQNCASCYLKEDESIALSDEKVEEYLIKIYSHPERYLDRTGDDFATSTAGKTSQQHNWLGGVFNLTDVGIFMILYLSIALLLVFAYIHFKVARRRRFNLVFCLHRLCTFNRITS